MTIIPIYQGLTKDIPKQQASKFEDGHVGLPIETSV
jgi:hypothetical protein